LAAAPRHPLNLVIEFRSIPAVLTPGRFVARCSLPPISRRASRRVRTIPACAPRRSSAHPALIGPRLRRVRDAIVDPEGEDGAPFHGQHHISAGPCRVSEPILDLPYSGGHSRRRPAILTHVKSNEQREHWRDPAGVNQ